MTIQGGKFAEAYFAEHGKILRKLVEPTEHCENPKKPARERQVGGHHYVGNHQPWDIIDSHGLDYYEGNALKYLLRCKDTAKRVEDLQKAIHYLEKCIENEKV